MNDVIKNMFERRTIRKYTDQSVTEEVLQQLYEVVESTQSWGNTQCWELVNVCSPALRKEIQATLPTQNPSYVAIVNAPVLLVVCAKKGQSGKIGEESPSKHGDWYMFDLGLATQNLCLAAHSLGLGSVVVGWFDNNKVEEIIKTPSDVEVVAIVPLGYRNQKGSVPAHKPAASFTHTDTF